MLLVATFLGFHMKITGSKAQNTKVGLRQTQKLLHKGNNQQNEMAYILFIRVKSSSINCLLSIFTMKEFCLLTNAFSLMT